MKHIIFDIGNVLLAFQPQAFLQKHFAPSVVDDLMAMVFGSAEWEALDMGTMMTNDAILALANKHPRCRDEIAFVLENWTHMLTPLEQNVAIAQELKRSGYALYLLSNFHKEAWETVLARYDFSACSMAASFPATSTAQSQTRKFTGCFCSVISYMRAIPFSSTTCPPISKPLRRPACMGCVCPMAPICGQRCKRAACSKAQRAILEGGFPPLAT